jgi:hypothetical protein
MDLPELAEDTRDGKSRIVVWTLRQELQSDHTAELDVLGFVDHTHASAAEFLDDVVVRDSLADHAQGCYGGSADKSMIGGELEAFQEGDWRNITITLKTPPACIP